MDAIVAVVAIVVGWMDLVGATVYLVLLVLCVSAGVKTIRECIGDLLAIAIAFALGTYLLGWW